MRTKTLIIVAAALSIGVCSSMAQTYSQNIVGYVTQVLPLGYSMIVCPLNTTNTGNTIPASQALTCLQSGDAVLLYSAGSYSAYSFVNYGLNYTWQYPDGTYGDTPPNITLGQAFFYLNGQFSGSETNTFTGTVVLSNSVALPVGYSMVGSTAPVAGATTNTATFNFPIQDGDALILYNAGSYSAYTFVDYGLNYTWQYSDGTYGDTPPNLIVGQGFFYHNGQFSGSETWQQNVVVQ
jgi:hypothetical protein